jgi:hypothetical protein
VFSALKVGMASACNNWPLYNQHNAPPAVLSALWLKDNKLNQEYVSLQFNMYMLNRCDQISEYAWWHEFKLALLVLL